MGDGILDGYPIIQDQTSPNLAHIPTTNLLTYSEDLNANWTKYSNTLATDDAGTTPINTNNATLVQKNGQSYARIEKSISLSSNTYTFSVFAKKGITDWIKLRTDGSSVNEVAFDLNNGVVGQVSGSPYYNIENIGNGWYRCSIAAIDNITIARLYVADADAGWGNTNDASAYFWGVQLEAQAQATPYLKSDGIAAVRKSSTTNTLPYSEDFSQWSLVNTTLTSGQASPDNNTNAYKLIPTSSNSIHSLRVFSVTGQTFSVTAKKGEYKNLLIWSDASSKGLGVNLDDNSIFRNVGVAHYNITELTDGWKRIDVTLDASYTGTFAFYVYDNSATPQITFAGNGIDGLFIYAAQLEEQTQAETYAKTTGLPVTIDLVTENNYGTMTNMSASDIIEDTPNN